MAELVVEAMGILIWPALLALIFFLLLPTLRDLLSSRGFTLKVGSSEISVQQAGDQLGRQLDDLRQRIEVVAERVETLSESEPESAYVGEEDTATAGLAPGVIQVQRQSIPYPERILWVDDSPQNNAFEVSALQDRGVDVILVHSTAEARAELGSNEFEAVITDMHRIERGVERRTAGLELAGWIRQWNPVLPLLLYCGRQSLFEFEREIQDAGFSLATNSSSELLAGLRLERLLTRELVRLLGAIGEASSEARIAEKRRVDILFEAVDTKLIIEAQIGNWQLTRPRVDVVRKVEDLLRIAQADEGWIVFFRLGDRERAVEVAPGIKSMHLSRVPAEIERLRMSPKGG